MVKRKEPPAPAAEPTDEVVFVVRDQRFTVQRAKLQVRQPLHLELALALRWASGFAEAGLWVAWLGGRRIRSRYWLSWRKLNTT